jgi:hypothetical protein
MLSYCFSQGLHRLTLPFLLFGLSFCILPISFRVALALDADTVVLIHAQAKGGHPQKNLDAISGLTVITGHNLPIEKSADQIKVRLDGRFISTSATENSLILNNNILKLNAQGEFSTVIVMQSTQEKIEFVDVDILGRSHKEEFVLVASKVPPKDHDDLTSRLRFTPVFSYSSISSNDLSNGTSAHLISNLNTGLNLRWAKKWSDSFQGFVAGGIENSTYQTDVVGKTVSGSQQTLSHFDLGVSARLASRLRIEGHVGATQELIAGATSLINVQLDQGLFPEAGLELDFRLLTLRKTSLSLKAGGYVLLPKTVDGYNIELGDGYLAAAEITQDLSRAWLISAGSGFRSQTQNTNVTKQTFEEIEFVFGVQFAY